MQIAVKFGFALLLAVAMPIDLEAKETTAEKVTTPLQEYVNAPDDSYKWEVRGQSNQNGCVVLDIHLTSQTWQNIKWQHTLSAFMPENVKHQNTVLLFITGGQIGSPANQEDINLGTRLAKMAQMPCMILHTVPNQPLFGGYVEDDLITETFLKYLETKDETWPLLFPMVKSAVKAMDAIGELANQRLGTSIDQFVVTGASKRGWTSWLTAVADSRVIGVAPIVIDTLNFKPQMKGQIERWGEYSEQIIDYTSKGLVKKEPDAMTDELMRWIDPYTYHKQLTLPKLLIHGTNDRYWVVDAMNQYWDDLVGPKHVIYVPNAGHGLGGGKLDALTTLAVFAQHSASKKSLPKLEWKHDDNGKKYRLTLETNEQPQRVQLWVAKSKTTDFRESKWIATEMEIDANGKAIAFVEQPEKGHIAFFGEATYPFGPLDYGLSTQIRVE